MTAKEFFKRNSERLILLLIACAIALGGYSLSQQRAAITEACQIQQRGLAAGKHLEAFFVDWATLLNLQQEKLKQAQQLRKESKQERVLTQAAVAEIYAYAAAVRAQPKHRTCP